MERVNFPLVVLAGGEGSRISDDGLLRPKPMIDVGERPVIWHLMKYYSSFGVRDFILCLGAQGDLIRDYFLNYHRRNVSLSVQLGNEAGVEVHDSEALEDWKITLVDTGLHSTTGERIKLIQPFVGDRTFLMAYGDGLGNVEISESIAFHRSHGGYATVVSVHPPSRFGLVEMDLSGKVERFGESPVTDSWINGGFYVLEPQIFDYLQDAEPWEFGPMGRLAHDGALYSFKHDGFWTPIDTKRDLIRANALWGGNQAPWKVW